jgi:coiled-coil and C2 domain-containing protein 1
MEEHTKKDLDSLRFAFKRGDPVPKFHYEVRSFSKVVCCFDLTDNELEFAVVQGINLSVAKDAHTYCRLVHAAIHHFSIYYTLQWLERSELL